LPAALQVRFEQYLCRLRLRASAVNNSPQIRHLVLRWLAIALPCGERILNGRAQSPAIAHQGLTPDQNQTEPNDLDSFQPQKTEEQNLDVRPGQSKRKSGRR
jgi:hypothetical protein